MDELEHILRSHAEKYPLMQPQDAVKLIYQNEFGSGHMIRDAASCLQWLRNEYRATGHDPSAPISEPIGNGIYRVYLAAVSPEDVDALGNAFLRTAAECQGDMQRFQEKLAVLIRVAEAGAFAFSASQLRDYLSDYRLAGFPAVSHSQIYRDAYSPAYRIIRK